MRVIAATTVSISIFTVLVAQENNHSCQLKAPSLCTDDIDYLNCVLSDRIKALNASASALSNDYDGCKYLADNAGFCINRPSEMSMYCCNVHAKVCLSPEENAITTDDNLPLPPSGVFFDIEEATTAVPAVPTVHPTTTTTTSSSPTTASTTKLTTKSTTRSTTTTTSSSKPTTTTTSNSPSVPPPAEPLEGASFAEFNNQNGVGGDREQQDMAGAENLEFSFCGTLDKYMSVGSTVIGKLRALFPQLFPSQAVIDQTRALSQKFPALFPKLQERRAERALQEEDVGSMEDFGMIDLESLMNAETITMLIETMIAPGLNLSGTNFTAAEEELSLFAHSLVVKLEECDNCLLGLIRATMGPLFEEPVSDEMKKLEQKRVNKLNESALIKLTAEEFSYRLVISIDRLGDEIEAIVASKKGKMISLTEYIDDLLTVMKTLQAEDDLGGISGNAMSIALSITENMKDPDVLADVMAEASLLYVDTFGCGGAVKDEEFEFVPERRMLQHQLRGDDVASAEDRGLLRENGNVDMNALMSIILEKQIEARDETMQLLHEKSLIRNTRALQDVDVNQKQSNFIPDIRTAQDQEAMLGGQPCEDHPDKMIASLEARYKDVTCGSLLSEVGCAGEGFFLSLPEIVKSCKGSWWTRCAAVLETMPQLKELIEGYSCESEAIVIDGFSVEVTTVAPTSIPTSPPHPRGDSTAAFSRFHCVLLAAVVFFM